MQCATCCLLCVCVRVRVCPEGTTSLYYVLKHQLVKEKHMKKFCQKHQDNNTVSIWNTIQSQTFSMITP